MIYYYIFVCYEMFYENEKKNENKTIIDAISIDKKKEQSIFIEQYMSFT